MFEKLYVILYPYTAALCRNISTILFCKIDYPDFGYLNILNIQLGGQHIFLFIISKIQFCGLSRKIHTAIKYIVKNIA